MHTAPAAARLVPVLTVEDLTTVFPTPRGLVKAVDGLSFSVGAGRVMGLVGESGSGKSVTGYSIMGLVEPPGHIAGGRILFAGRDLVRQSRTEMRSLRGRAIAMIFQDPAMTLNPVLRISTQMVEAIRAHEKISRAEAWKRSRDALGLVGIPSPDERMSAYPHEFSGGMRQRVAIAIALLHRPSLIIADEPTTALDVTIQSQILARMQLLMKQYDMAMIWISHDLSVVSRLCDDIAVMYAGRLVETGLADRVIAHPRHPYTRGLIDSLPSRARRGERLRQIEGMMPEPLDLPEGCVFSNRCPRADAACRANPVMSVSTYGAWQWRCVHPLNEGPVHGHS